MSKQFSATVSYSPVFHLTLSKDIVDLIVEKGLSHYDGTCRAACKQGGFIYGWRNCVNFEATCIASFRELDLTLKILENFCGDVKEAKACLEYNIFIRDLLEQSNNNCIQAPLEPTEAMIIAAAGECPSLEDRKLVTQEYKAMLATLGG